MEKFILETEYITLAQFLKATNYISSGGEAKYFLKEYTVLVNNIECDLRGKKLYNKDIINVDNTDYILSHD